MRIAKTPNTAVVLIPTENLWAPLQSIRKAHDAHFHRWMPHITLLFPFLPADVFSGAEPKIESACREAAPFRVRLARFEYFQGPKTVWLEPEPAETVKQLQSLLQSRFPECDDVARFPGGFRPHLSVGQGPPALQSRLQADWKPVEFEARDVALIQRDGPEDPFRIHRTFPLMKS
jgi:2'-5' RNA ligase